MNAAPAIWNVKNARENFQRIMKLFNYLTEINIEDAYKYQKVGFLQLSVSFEDWRRYRKRDGVESNLVLFICFSSPAPSFSFTGNLPGSNNTSPERDGTEGKKNGAFSGFFGGSIGLLRTWNSEFVIQQSGQTIGHLSMPENRNENQGNKVSQKGS